MKSLRILSNPEEIRFIANEHAYAILNLLRREEYSGTGIAHALGMMASRAAYYLRKLEMLDLAEIVRTEEKKGITEKFFRATAEHFIVYTDVGTADEDISLSMSNAYVNRLQYYEMEKSIDIVINTVVDDCLRIANSDRVLITFCEETMEFMKRLVIRLRNISAEHRIIMNNDDLSLDQWASMPINRIESLYKQMSAEIAWSNVCINIGRGSTRPDLSNIPSERVKRISEIRSNAFSELNGTKDRRVLLFDRPMFGKEFFSDTRILDRLRMYWKATSLKKSDYSRMKTINDFLMRNDCISIRSGQHHGLEVRFDKSKYFLDAGPYTKSLQADNTYYMPSGEVSFLPMENGITGNVYCETSCGISGSISGIRLRINNNIVVDAKADEGQELLNSMLESYGVLGRTVSQVCFGLNSEVKSAELLPEIGSKLYGSISIGFGNNIMLGGNITDPQPWSVISLSPEVRSGNELILSDNEY